MLWAANLLSGVALLAVPIHARPQTAQINTAIANTTGNAPSHTQEQTLVAATPTNLGGSGWRSYHSPAWLPHNGQGTRPNLPQSSTNGNSRLGTWGAPRFQPFIPGGPMPGGWPWGGRTAGHTNQYEDVPNTGMTRHYDFTVSQMQIAPDGVVKNGLVVNGQFPGPTIEANWGDWIEVVVHNQLEEGTSLHWHGLLQKETPWFDGVPSVDQCPIAPGATFTYRFRADLYGTTWYHSHYSAQFAGGAFGPLIIHGPSDNANYDEDLGPVLVHDWYHNDYFSLVEQVMAPAAENLLPPLSNNVLINGKMNYPCSNETQYPCTPNAGISKFSFQSGKIYRLRLINAGAEGIQKFSIDGHTMTVIANDFVPLKPYDVDVVTLGVGQRTDIIVKATGKPDDAFWMRSELGISALEGGCSLTDGVSPTGVAAIYYEKADNSSVPTSNSTVPAAALASCQNDPLSDTVPYFSISPPANPDTVQEINITYQNNGTHNLFYMNNSTFRANYNDPILLGAKLGRTEFDASYNVYNFQDSRSIRLVIYNHAVTGAHPMHLHGHNMYVLAEGTGTWDGSIVNAGNPQRRKFTAVLIVEMSLILMNPAPGDTHLLATAPSATTPSYIVIQYDADNPGAWPMHCHIAWHVSAGLYVNLVERPDDIQRDMDIPGIMAQTCRDWSAFTGENVVEEIDSGL